jgi:glycosyltransferase involved in cell wall biosynthesis
VVDVQKPLVSILIPFFRVEGFIERCARSAFEQTYPNLEFLFLDDGSPDNSLAILQRTLEDYPQRAPQTRILRNPRNIGLAATRNVAVENCRGEFLYWIDADDYVIRTAIQTLMDLQRRAGADIVTGRMMETGTADPQEVVLARDSRMETIRGILDSNVKTQITNRLIRTSLYREHGIRCLEGFNYREDFQVVPKLFFFADTVSRTQEITYFYELGNANSYNNAAKAEIRTKIEKDIQDLKATQMIGEFFADTLPEVNTLNKEHEVYFLREIIRDATRAGDKALFMETMKKLKDVDYRYVKRFASRLYVFSHLSPSLCWFVKRARLES